MSNERALRAGAALASVVCAFALVPAVGLSANAEVRAATSSLAKGVLAGINAVRAGHGLAPLRVSAALDRAALSHCRQLLRDGFFGHQTAAGAPLAVRIAYYYPSDGSSLYAVGENLLWSVRSISGRIAVTVWMGSPPHRANILAPDWREIGVAALTVPSAPGVYHGLNVSLLTVDFGVRRPAREAAWPGPARLAGAMWPGVGASAAPAVATSTRTPSPN